MFTTLRNTLFVLLISLSASVASEDNLSQQIDVTPGGQLVVDVDFGTIQVDAGADGKVTLDAHRRVEFGDENKEKEYLAAAPITVTKEGNVVTVQIAAQGIVDQLAFWSFKNGRQLRLARAKKI